ncbi:MAG TPA: sulfotransferase [Candidatus Competibacter sp.]|jgi:hypothetical protein|nr:sulfotransferase [Candidatus Competibacter sp.]HUM91606.1 sulfotransferase [Candidatus Competibacter sp.]
MFSFLGIGAQKAGTTWLYEQISHHPQLAFPLGKEAHFWDRSHDKSAIADYLSRFADVAAIAGEITPSYAALPSSVVQEIHACNPQLRLIYLIRNPIDRAWSSALMALQRAQMTIDEASDAWFSDHFHSAASLKRGDYQACLQTWRTIFPNEQLLILRFEQIITEPELLLNRCFQHLGVAPVDPEQLRQQGCHEPVFTGPGHRLRSTLKPVLWALYQERIRQLAQYLGMDLSAWLSS